MRSRIAVCIAVVCAIILFPGAAAPGGRFDGDWTTHLACEAHGQTEAYKWVFPSTIKDNFFHGVHSESGSPGYLVIEGKIADDGSAKLEAKGTVTQNHAHGVFAMKGNNYSYNIKAQFTDTKGTGTRDEGAGILGRPCTFEFDKQTSDKPADSPTPDSKPQDSKPSDAKPTETKPPTTANAPPSNR